MNKTLFFSLAFCLSGFYAWTQPPMVQYMENVGYFNPAAVAYQPCDSFRVTAFYRNQWLGLNGNPEHIAGMAEYNLSKINSGIGLNFTHEKIGLNTNIDVGLSYRYSLKFKKSRALSAGLSVNYYHMRVKGLFVGPQTSFYENSSAAKITSRFGLFYSSRSLVLGISVFHPTQPELQLDPSFWTFKLSRVFNFHGSYKFQLNQKNTLSPELIVFANLDSYFTLINLKWNHNDRLFVGAGTRNIPVLNTSYSPNVSFGYKFFGKLYLGAAYEHHFYNFFDKSTLEFMLKFEIPSMTKRNSGVEFEPAIE